MVARGEVLIRLHAFEQREQLRPEGDIAVDEVAIVQNNLGIMLIDDIDNALEVGFAALGAQMQIRNVHDPHRLAEVANSYFVARHLKRLDLIEAEAYQAETEKDAAARNALRRYLPDQWAKGMSAGEIEEEIDLEDEE